MKHTWMLCAVALVMGCGGGKKSSGTTPGDNHVGDDLDVDNNDKKDTPVVTVDAGAAAPVAVDGGTASTAPPPTGPLVTFRLKNTHADKDLVFSIDKGWQPVIFAYSGKPPNAKGVLLFPKFCTASCDSEPDARCPYCPKPKKNKQEKKLEKREIVKPSEHKDVAWDGQIFVYEKTKGKRKGRTKRCDCWKKQAIPPETYTVKACGFRLTKDAEKRSLYECPSVEVKLPPDKPTVVELEFSGKKK
jgi:hypothetical protein